MLNLKEIAARCEAATEGPWEVCKEGGADAICSPDTIIFEICEGPILCCSPKKNELDFIAHARTDIPALHKEVKRLRKLVEDAYYEGGSTVTDFEEPFDEDNSLWLDSESRKALEDE